MRVNKLPLTDDPLDYAKQRNGIAAVEQNVQQKMRETLDQYEKRLLEYFKIEKVESDGEKSDKKKIGTETDAETSVVSLRGSKYVAFEVRSVLVHKVNYFLATQRLRQTTNSRESKASTQ